MNFRVVQFLWILSYLASCGHCRDIEQLNVLWHAPFRSGGGYCSEAYAMTRTIGIISMKKHQLDVQVHPFHHGDSINYAYLSGLKEDSQDAKIAKRASMYIYPPNGSKTSNIAVCHSEPGAWDAPFPKYHTFPCPPSRGTIDYKIGRTMFETDSIPSWLDRLSFMDEIWVPTRFHADIFERAGLPPEKVVVVGEPVDTSFFKSVDVDSQRAFRAKHLGSEYEGKFLILFVGKWETRKGLKILLKAFYEEFVTHTNVTMNASGDMNFERDKDVVLVVLTSAYHSSDDFTQKIDNYLQGSLLCCDESP